MIEPIPHLQPPEVNRDRVHAPICAQASMETKNSFTRGGMKRLRYQLAPPPRFAPQGTYVGELQEKWAFPSDHLPIGAVLDGIKVISWNVLNPLFIGWVIDKNSQGLSRSQIAQEHIPMPNSSITIRENHIIEELLSMIKKGQSVLSLQECGTPFLNELEARLPSGFCLLREQKGIVNNQNAVIYNNQELTVLEQRAPVGVFSQTSHSFQDILFKRKGDLGLVRIVNAHLPGDPIGPARFEFASYLKQSHQADIPTVALGDMNFNELEMQEAFQASPFAIYTPYCTNVAPNILVSKAIDHFIVEGFSAIAMQKPDAISPGLSRLVSLLTQENI